MSIDEHNWFDDHATAYVIDGLSADERARVESHAAECPACAAKLAAISQTDQTMNALFASIRPTAGIEEAIIRRLDRPMRLVTRAKVNPFVRRAAVAAAAAIVLAGFGYVASEKINNGRFPAFAFNDVNRRIKEASNLRQVGQAVLLYNGWNGYEKTLPDRNVENLVQSAMDQVPAQMRNDVQSKSDGGPGAVDALVTGSNAHQMKSAVTPVNGNKGSYSDILRYPENWADAGPRTTANIPAPNDALIATASRAQKWDYGGGTSAASDWSGFNSSHAKSTADAPNHSGASENVLYGDGRVELGTNPFVGMQRDNAYTGKPAQTVGKPAILNGPYDGNDAILLPTGDDETPNSTAARSGSSPGQKPADNGGISVAGTGTSLTLSGTNTYMGGTVITGGTYSLPARGVQLKPPADLPALSYYQPGATLARADSSGQAEPGAQANTSLQLTTPLGNGDASTAVESGNRSSTEIGPSERSSTKDGPDFTNAPGFELAQATNPSPQPAAAQPPPASESQPPAPAPQAFQRKIIRNGTMDFTVDSFDSAFLQVSAIVNEEGGFIATTNSQKMPNGKVEGTITVRIAPDHLDVLVLKLRALGELKDQKITAEDITKDYTDLASELRAARAMEERLLDLIKDGKGAIKDLLAAEKELGDWREKIEKITGQMNYYDNLVSLSTLELTLTERDIKTPALASDTETVDMGVETEDVEKGRADAISAIEEVKGRIVESELKAFDAGQLAGKIVADIPSDKAGPVIDHLKQLGKVSRLEVQRQELTTDGHGNAVNADTLPPGLRVEQKDTRLTLSLYNLANVAPRQTANVELACDDVETSYHTILDRVAKANGRVLSSNLSRPTPDQVTGTLSFEVKSTDADGVLMDVKQAGQVMQSNVVENLDTNNVTATKRGFSVNLRPLASVNPREVSNMSIAAPDVISSYNKLLTSLQGVKARIILSRLDKEEQGDATERAETAGFIDFEVKRDDLDAVDHALADAGDLIQRQVMRSNDEQNTLDSKLQFKVGLHNATLLPPREDWTLALESGDVESRQADVLSAVTSAGGRVIDSTLSKESSGHTSAHMIVDVPFNQSAVLVDHVKHEGDLRVVQSTKNPQAPEGRLSRSRLEITIATPEAIISPDHGLWNSIRAGLSTSVAGLMWSLQLIIIGLCFVVPWVVAIWVGWKIVKRRSAKGA